MKKILSIFAIAAALLFTACEKSEPEAPEEPAAAPQLISADPADGETGIAASSLDIRLTFDCNVMCPTDKQSSITIDNGAAITSVNAYMTVVTVSVSGLQPATTYTLTFPAGAVTGYKDNPAGQIRYTFSTGEPAKPAEEKISTSLVTENPSANAVRLYDYLRSVYHKKSLSAAMAKVDWNVDEAEWIHTHTGKYPAIATFDYIHLQASWSSYYGDITVAREWFEAGGIISAGWHWNVPATKGDYTCTTSETSMRPTNALKEGTWEHETMMADLEKIAGYLKLLCDEGIPVIWRPLHEAAGNTYTQWHSGAWFWWGADGAEPYKALWRYMFDYFKTQGLNNLIWVWTSQTSSAADADFDFYPGDEYVDIIGKDIYNNLSAAAIFSEYSAVKSFTNTKMLTLSEFGNVAPIAGQWNEGAEWLYFMPWYDYDNDWSEGYKHSHATISWWKEAFDSEMVVDRDSLPEDLYE